MPYILLDTHIFRKLKGEYNKLLDCISKMGDTILLSKEIKDEYQGRIKPTYLGYISYINNINRMCKLKYLRKSRINAKFKRYKRKIKMPEKDNDHKWVKTAISEQAKYIISNDKDLFLPPFRTDDDLCHIISPNQYIQKNCSDL